MKAHLQLSWFGCSRISFADEFHYKSLAIVGGVSLVWHSKNFQNSAEKLLDTLMMRYNIWCNQR